MALNHNHHSFPFDFSGLNPQRPVPLTPTFPSGRLQPLSTPPLIPISFQGRVVMKSSPSDVCSSEAAGRVGRAAEQAKASPLQTG